MNFTLTTRSTRRATWCIGTTRSRCTQASSRVQYRLSNLGDVHPSLWHQGVTYTASQARDRRWWFQVVLSSATFYNSRSSRSLHYRYTTFVPYHRSRSLYFWQRQCSKAHGCIVWYHDRWFSLYALALFDTPDLASVLPDIVHDCLYRYRRTILCVAISPKFLKAPYLLPFIPCKLRYRLLSLDTEHLSKTQVIVLRTFVFS